jgi:hypothetical protein
MVIPRATVARALAPQPQLTTARGATLAGCQALELAAGTDFRVKAVGEVEARHRLLLKVAPVVVPVVAEGWAHAGGTEVAGVLFL